MEKDVKLIVAVLSSLLFISMSALANTRFEQCLAERDGTFNDCGLDDSDMPELVKYLQQHPNRKSELLDLRKNFITDAGLQQLLAQPNFSDLDISENKITDASAPALTQLVYVELDKNAITDDGALILAASKNLRFVFLNETKVTDVGAIALAKNNNLEAISLEGDGITDKGALGFSKREKIGMLYLANNKISDDGAIALSGIKYDFYILDLSHNNIGDKGAIALAKNHTISQLAYNHITDAGLQAFIDYSTPDFLDIPDLEGNQLTDRSVVALCNTQNNTLPYRIDLSLGNNKITLDGIKKLLQCGNFIISLANSHYGDAVAELFGATNLTYADLSGNDITDTGVTALMRNHQWSSLNLNSNEITDNGFMESMSIQQYYMLNLNSNQITDHAMDALLQSQNRIEYLGIDRNMVSEEMKKKLKGSKQVGKVIGMNY